MTQIEVKAIISRLNDNESTKQEELAEVCKTTLFDIVCARLEYFKSLGQKEINRLARIKRSDRQRNSY